MIVYVTLSQFKKLFRPEVNSTIFESKKRLIGLVSGITVSALKTNPDKLYVNAIPIIGVGYPGIATMEDKSAVTEEEIVTDIYSLLEDLEKDVSKKILKRVSDSINEQD